MIALSPLSLLAAFGSTPTLAACEVAAPFTLGDEIDVAEMVEPETDEGEPPAGEETPVAEEAGSFPWLPPILGPADMENAEEVPAVPTVAANASPPATEGAAVEAPRIALPPDDLSAEATIANESGSDAPPADAPTKATVIVEPPAESDAALPLEPSLPPPEGAEMPQPAQGDPSPARQQAAPAVADTQPAEAPRAPHAADAPAPEPAPDDLGDLQVTLEGEGETIRVTLTSESPETVQEMRRHAETLREDLAKQGFGQASLSFQQREGGRQQGRSGQGGAEAPATFTLTRPEAAASGLDLRL